MKRLTWLILGCVTTLTAGGAVVAWRSPIFRAGSEAQKGKKAAGVGVGVVRPAYRPLDRITVEQGTVQAYDSVEVFAAASGFLETQSIDLGAHVTKDQVLAKIAVPDLEAERDKAKANWARAKFKVKQAQKGVARARAEVAVAETGVPAARAVLKAAQATTRYREKAYARVESLRREDAVDARLLDESRERRDSAVASEESAAAALAMAQVQIDAAKSKLEQAQADEEAVGSEVDVAWAEVRHLEVRIGFSVIRAPFTGVITRRHLSRGDYVRSAAQGERVPVFTIARTDVVRVVVPIPDRHVPFADEGDPATVEVQNLGGKVFQGRISRIQGGEDTATRTMRVEIDLPNPDGELRPNTFAKVTVNLQHVDRALLVPSGCLQGEAKEGKGHVFVVRQGRAVLVPIRIGADNGVEMEVLAGLDPEDDVVRNYSGTLADGSPVWINSQGP